MLGLITTVFCAIVVGAQNWDRNVVLDPEGNYHLYWTLNGNTVVFQVEVATTGWVGFGISPNGGMSGSDVVIGWVTNGQPIFHDRHAVGKFMPIIDERQDWELLWSHENDTHILFRFQRELNTCDDEDRPITGPTTRLIYAYSETDPDTEETVTYHGPVNRGTKTVSLSQEIKEKPNLGAPEDLLYWEVRSPNVTVPHDSDTTYLCTVFKRPNLDRLHHVIKAEAVIQPGNERYVHHAVLSECNDVNETEFETYLSGYRNCYSKEGVNFFSCFSLAMAWAIGGEAIYLPENVGLPFGRGNSVYYVLEVHYDNPGYTKGIVDSSGLIITYTPKLREYNGGLMGMGTLWNSCMFIPPRQKEFVIAGHAHPTCFRQDIPKDGIKVFGSLLHTHLAGKKVRIRHFRGKQELPPLGSDDNYDFNFQNTMMFSEEHNVLPNDHLILECTYDTSQRKEPTFGGLSTHEEMCLAFFMYYPEIQLAFATSCPAPSSVVKLLGVSQISSDNRYVVSPITGKNQSYVEFLNSYPWDDNSVNVIQKAMKYGPQINTCIGREGKPKVAFPLAKYPKRSKTYRKRDECDEREIEGKDSYSETADEIPQILPYFVSEQIENE